MKLRFAGVFVALTASGCTSIGPIGDISESVPVYLSFNCVAEAGPETKSLFTEVDTGPAVGIPVELPGELATDKVANALLQTVMSISADQPAIRSADIFTYVEPDPIQLSSFSAEDFEDFMQAFADTALEGTEHVTESATPEIRSEGSAAKPVKVFREYYRHYIKGDFVTRFGAKLAKPEIGKTIGNDTLTGVLTVFLEAVSDLALQTPVFKTTKDGKDVYFPGQSKEIPTSVALEITPVEAIAENSEVCGVTKREAEAIAWLSNLAEDKSSILSGLALESLSGIELSLIIGGDFAIGDNETLAVLVKAFAGVTSKRVAEYGAYKFLWHFSYSTPPAARSGGGIVLPSASASQSVHVDGAPAAAPRSAGTDEASAAAEEAERKERLDNVAEFLDNFE